MITRSVFPSLSAFQMCETLLVMGQEDSNLPVHLLLAIGHRVLGLVLRPETLQEFHPLLKCVLHVFTEVSSCFSPIDLTTADLQIEGT